MIDPVAFSFGDFLIHWYALSYFLGFLLAIVFLFWRHTYGAISGLSREELFDGAFVGFLGGIIGGRLGYVILYDLPFFVQHPWRIISPFDANGVFVGIAGMSFFGAILGGAIAVSFFARIRGWNILRRADDFIPAIPIGIFFGRIGNFLNGELYGRPSNISWAMDFGDGILRHPSQLYEAFLEGAILFSFLFWLSRRHDLPDGSIVMAFLGGYGVLRFFAEFFREPDAHIGYIAFGWMTLGQGLSVIAVVIAIVGICLLTRKGKSGTIKKVV